MQNIYDTVQYKELNYKKKDGIGKFCLSEVLDEDYIRSTVDIERLKKQTVRFASARIPLRTARRETLLGRRGFRIALVTAAALVLAIGGLEVFFHLPYSNTRAEFDSLRNTLLAAMPKTSEVFTEDALTTLPVPVRKYFNVCGFLGRPRMNAMKAVHRGARYVSHRGAIPIVVDYTQYLNTLGPCRLDLTVGWTYGMPFESIECFSGGKCSVKGVLGKAINLYCREGDAMNVDGLAAFLSECLLCPSAALQDYITWEEIDALHAGARIACHGLYADGIFTFGGNGELISFTSDNRAYTAPDGTSEICAWSMVFRDYQQTDGLWLPTDFHGIWHFQDGDLLSFDGDEVIIEYDPELT